MTKNYDQIAGLVTSLGLDPQVDCRIIRDEKGDYMIEPGSWKSELPEPTPDLVDKFIVPEKDPDKEPARPLEKGDYKTLISQLETANTVIQLRAVLKAYLAKKAGE